MRKGILMDLVLTNKEGLDGDVKFGGSLGCSDNEILYFKILQGGSSAITLQSWTSGELTLPFSGINLEESHGIRP